MEVSSCDDSIVGMGSVVGSTSVLLLVVSVASFILGAVGSAYVLLLLLTLMGSLHVSILIVIVMSFCPYVWTKFIHLC